MEQDVTSQEQVFDNVLKHPWQPLCSHTKYENNKPLLAWCMEVTIKGVCCQLFETQGYFGMKAWIGVHVQPCAPTMELNIIWLVILNMNIMNANHKSGFIVQIEYIKLKKNYLDVLEVDLLIWIMISMVMLLGMGLDQYKY